MTITADESYRDLLEELASLRELVDKGELDQARSRGLELKRASASRGIRSAHLFWQLAIIFDYAGEFELAYEHIKSALELDPLSHPLWSSYRIIIGRTQRTLTDESRPPDDPLRPRLHALLCTANELTQPCHLAIARYYRHAGRPAEALRVLEALTTLHPAYSAAWRELLKAARALGREDLVELAESHAYGVEDDSSFPPMLAQAQA